MFKWTNIDYNDFSANILFMRILHIDDSPEICKLYADFYADKNSSLTSVNDGKKGLDLVLKNDYDVILLDMCMPKYGGMDFLQDLKEKRPSELKKVIVMSVLHYNEAQIKGLIKFGVHSVEEKPSQMVRLEPLLKRLSDEEEEAKSCLKKMLIVDDNPDTTMMLTKFFNTRGFQVVAINDPWEGLKQIRKERYNVIILDMVIPKFSGLQIISTLASEEILQDQNIFVFSASYANEIQRKELLRRDGINGCLKKPMNLHDMLKIITLKSDFAKIISN